MEKLNLQRQGRPIASPGRLNTTAEITIITNFFDNDWVDPSLRSSRRGRLNTTAEITIITNFFDNDWVDPSLRSSRRGRPKFLTLLHPRLEQSSHCREAKFLLRQDD